MAYEIDLFKSTYPNKSVVRNSNAFTLFGDMDLDAFSDKFADVTLFCLGAWTENVGRVLIQILAGVDHYVILLRDNCENHILGKFILQFSI